MTYQEACAVRDIVNAIDRDSQLIKYLERNKYALRFRESENYAREDERDILDEDEITAFRELIESRRQTKAEKLRVYYENPYIVPPSPQDAAQQKT